MEKFKALLKSFIEEVDKIDKETPWIPIEPDWWIDMMNLQRLAIKVREWKANVQRLFGVLGDGMIIAVPERKDGWCKQHHPDTVKLREEANDRRAKERYEMSPYGHLTQALEKIKKLEDRIKEFEDENRILNERILQVDEKGEKDE